MSESGYSPKGTAALADLVALVHYERACTLHSQMAGLYEGLKGGSVERGLAAKIQESLPLAATVSRDMLQAVYGAEAVEVGEIQRAVDEALHPKGGRTPFFTRSSSPTFTQNPPHFLHD